MQDEMHLLCHPKFRFATSQPSISTAQHTVKPPPPPSKNALPRTRKVVYNHGGRQLNKIPSKGGFDTPTVHVQNWTRAWLLQFYASQPGVRDPQTLGLCEQWANTRLRLRVKDFAQRVLWHKLTVHERVYKRSGTDKCPICS